MCCLSWWDSAKLSSAGKPNSIILCLTNAFRRMHQWWPLTGIMLITYWMLWVWERSCLSQICRPCRLCTSWRRLLTASSRPSQKTCNHLERTWIRTDPLRQFSMAVCNRFPCLQQVLSPLSRSQSYQYFCGIVSIFKTFSQWSLEVEAASSNSTALLGTQNLPVADMDWAMLVPLTQMVDWVTLGLLSAICYDEVEAFLHRFSKPPVLK